MTVMVRANGTLSLPDSLGQISAETERCVKYIANRPAKNMSSLASHTMVPTDTEFGRITLRSWLCWAALVVDTRTLLPEISGRVRLTS